MKQNAEWKSENLVRKINFHKILTRITGFLHEYPRTCMITPHSVLLGMRNVADQSYRENNSTHFRFKTFSENRAFCEITWKNVVLGRQATHDNIKGRMRFTCRITKVTNTHSELLTLIVFFFKTKKFSRKHLDIFLHLILLICILVKWFEHVVRAVLEYFPDSLSTYLTRCLGVLISP